MSAAASPQDRASLASKAQAAPLFLSCIISLVTVAFGFVIRSFLISDWRTQFNLSESQLGSIQGVGFYPQALTILFFSLIIDRIGYGRAMAFAFFAHLASIIITCTATGYTGLYLGTLVFALAGGTVEAVINPVTATLYPRDKTHRLNILHAGWPGGMVIGGLLAIAIGTSGGVNAWRWKVSLYLLPALVYGWLMLGKRFPVQERVAAGVSYNDMLREFGWVGCLVVSLFLGFAVDEVLRVFGFHLDWIALALIATVPAIFLGIRVKSAGRPMFIFLMFVMVLLATTELGTDSWIASLMTPILRKWGSNAGNCVLIYTSVIMFIMRFFAGPIAHRISPLGLLAASAAVAAAGLLWLAHAGTTAFVIFLAATCYACGKTFFWPTTLAVVSEQFPRGGALTLSAIAAVGTISVGVLGNPLLGTLQDRYLDRRLDQENPALHAQVTEAPETKYGMTFRPLDEAKVAALPAPEKAAIERLRIENNQTTLGTVALLPAIMFLCYLGLLFYFRARGGYRQIHMEPQAFP